MEMRLSAQALAMATAALWGGCMFFVGLVHVVFPAYGAEFLRVVSSIYPGYDAAPTLASLFIGTAWGIADGAVGGYLFAWLYDLAVDRLSRPPHPAV
jgi:hypothetical protein